MKNFKRIGAIILAITLVIGQSAVFALSDTAPQQAMPSPWAVWEVQMASTYGLGTPEMYTDYQKQAGLNDFLRLQSSLEGKFSVKDETKLASEVVTRGDVLNELADVINLALSLEISDKGDQVALNYFVKEGLIRGRSDANYALDQACTKEEMFALSKRTYDHIIYALDKASKGAFWKVSDDNNTVYLLGSIHVAGEGMYPLNKNLIEAFIASKALVVEANTLVIDPETSAYIQKIAMLEGETTIDSLISAETYKAYSEKATAIGLTPDVYNKLKPWYAGMLLQSVTMSKAAYSGQMGIDMYFMYLANGYMPIMEVEGIKYQVDLFDSFSKELQEGYLIGALSDETQSNELIGQMMAVWQSGDTQALETLLFSNDQEKTAIEKEFSEKLWDERNKHMTAYVEDLLKDPENKDYFFIVGAGHMLNNNGVIAGLKELGYEVTPDEQ